MEMGKHAQKFTTKIQKKDDEGPKENRELRNEEKKET